MLMISMIETGLNKDWSAKKHTKNLHFRSVLSLIVQVNWYAS